MCHTVSTDLGEKVTKMSPSSLLAIWDMGKEGKRTGKGERRVAERDNRVTYKDGREREE